MGNFFELIGRMLCTGLHQAVDVFCAGGHARCRTQMAEHGQGTGRLLERPVEHGQVMVTGGVTEIGVERLFDLRQVVLDLPGDLADQQFFLCPAGHFVEQGNGHIGCRFAGNAGIQASHHMVDLLGEVGAQALEAFLCVLQQQDSRCHLHRHRVAKTRDIFRQPVGNRPQALAQALQVGLTDFLGHRGNRAHLFGKGRQRGGTARRANPVPLLLDIAQHFAQAAQHGILWLAARNVLRAGQLCRQAKRGLHLRNDAPAIRTGLGDVIQGFAHQALSQATGTFQQATNLLIDTGADLTHGSIGTHRRIPQRFDEGQCRPPEGARRLGFLGGFDMGQGIQHQLPTLFSLQRLGQPQQETFLVAGTLILEQLLQFTRRQGRYCPRPLGRTQRQVGEEQVARPRRRNAPRFSQFEIDRHQAQRLIGLAGHQFVEISPHSSHRPANSGNRGIIERGTTFLKCIEQGFQRLGHLRDAVQANDRQGTMHLVHMRAAKLELGDIRLGNVLAKGRFRPLQRQVNFTLDPGQGAQIEFSCRVHSLSRSMFVNPP